MSSNGNLSSSFSRFLQTAELRLVSRRQWTSLHYRTVHLLISSRIYWKVADKDSSKKPLSVEDFRNADSLELIRLHSGDWKDINSYVKVVNQNGRDCITAHGRLHRRTLQYISVLDLNVQIEIEPSERKLLKVLVNQIRAQIVPWNLLKAEVKKVVRGNLSSEQEELKKVRDGLLTNRAHTKSSSTSVDEEDDGCDNFGTLPEQMDKLSFADNLIAHGAAAVATGATLTKLVSNVEQVAKTAEFVADLSKGITGVSTFFHLVSLSAHAVSLCAEASRGRKVLPDLLCQIGNILEYVLESFAELMKPSRNLNKIDIDFVLDALKQAVGAMEMAETQLLRGGSRKIMNAGDVKKAESELEQLRHMAVTAGNIWRNSLADEEENNSEDDRKVWNDGLYHVLPSLSAFFSGRTSELGTLRAILQKWGSTVIAQYGGVGKTELMIALAERAEQDGLVPGGVFWVTVDGGKEDVIESLAKLAEELKKQKMGKEERRNSNLVLGMLKEGLRNREGRWLLCLDNADDSEVSGILNEVCAIAGGSQERGWVAVTSRQGQPHLWNEMKREQKLVLEPLCKEDAMVALWRQIRKTKTSDADDDEVFREIKELERVNLEEYLVLQELCGDDGKCSLGGLPLALVQAGAYIAQFECSFADYRHTFENTSKLDEMQDIMNNTDQVKLIRKSQRSIWTTWKISVQQLSEKGSAVLGAMALLGPAGVGEGIMRRIVKQLEENEGSNVDRIFRKVVVGELVQGSSLIYWNKGERGKEECFYKMHRLVRRYILSGMKPGSASRNEAYNASLVTVHETVETELGKDGKSFTKLPEVFGSNLHELIAHAIALIYQHTLPVLGDEIQHVSKVEDIHRYCGLAMRFMGKVEEEVHVCERLLNILHHLQALKRRPSYSNGLKEKLKFRIAAAHHSLGVALMRSGKFDDAASQHKLSLSMKRKIYGLSKPHRNIAYSFNNLGTVYRRQGKLNEALEMHELGLQMLRAIYGPTAQNRAIAFSLNNLGIVYEKLGKLNEAEEKLKQSLKMRRAIHETKKLHHTIAYSLGNLGTVYEKLGKLGNALEEHESSLEMRLAIYGHSKNHPSIAYSRNGIGSVYQKLGKLAEALDVHEQSMKMSKEIHGANASHPSIAYSLYYLGSVHEKLGQLGKAMEMHEQSLKIRHGVYGPSNQHPAIADSLNDLSNVYIALGKLDKAYEMHKRSYEMRLAIHRPHKSHPDIAKSLNNLGIVYEKLGNLNDALEKLEQSLEMQQVIYVPNEGFFYIASSLNNLGNVYHRRGKLPEASEKYKESLRMFRLIPELDKLHPHIATSLENLSSVYEEAGELEKAQQKKQQSLEIRRAIQGNDEPQLYKAIPL